MSTPREKLLEQFHALVIERLGRVTRALTTLEAGADLEAGRAVLRDLHGLKGEARMMGFAPVNALVHEMEELVRVCEPLGFALSASSVDALLAVADAVAVLAGARPGSPAQVDELAGWLKTSIEAETRRMPAPSAPRPSAPAAPATRQGDSSMRISQHSLEVLTSGVSSLLQRSRRQELVGAQRRELARELAQLHRLAEELGPHANAFATRLGQAKELASESNRLAAMLATDELRDLTALAEEVTSLRMVPLSVLFDPWPRTVRELARALGREVDLTIAGEDEQVDRVVLEALTEPLMHLVRNAIDHGLEDAQDRVAAGKSPRGALHLEASREGERVVLRVRDDGRGMDPAHLRQVAVTRGLLGASEAARLPDAEAIDLIFAPGFTTRAQASDVSGRGVGLDVVRSRLIAIGGEVTLESRPGLGSTFSLRVPVSLTVAPVLFVQVGDERLCVSASSVVRAFAVEASQVRDLAGRPSLRVDTGDGEAVLPFATMASTLGLGAARGPMAGELALVISGRGQRAVIAVDRVLDERVQPILPLKGVLAPFEHLTGATAMADGTLALVVSPVHLVASAHGARTQLARLTPRAPLARRRQVLVVDDSPLTRELLVSLLEHSGAEVVQAEDGAEALEVLSRRSVDLVVTDLEMPKLDGLELTRRLKSHPVHRALPVIIVTTRGSASDRQRGLEAGADAWVTKGDMVRRELIDLVSTLLPVGEGARP
jgi:two-component system sensor histidine kinase and response regulator WspE